jgi:hypothetical protein
MQTRRSAPQIPWVRSAIVTTALVVAALVVFAGGPGAQGAPAPASSPFDIIGFIQDATVDAPGDVFSGGTITVNGTKVIVPRHTVLQMPAATLTWEEVFAKAPAGYAPTQSGLAMHDVPTPALTYEVHIMGNRVAATSDQFIAGLIFLSQQSLNAGAGFVNFIDYAAGELRVGGHEGDGATGARVRLNDPLGRFGRMDSPDVRFSIDEESPTIRSQTAFPMCLPRTDPAVKDDGQCPQRNRPKDFLGRFLPIFTYPPPKDPLPPGAPDARLMMPFEVGDYITYHGNLYTDADGRPYVSAWAITANVGAFTAPGWKPAYVAIDVMVLGIGGVPIPGLPQEAVVRTRVEGFTTDPTRPVMVFAVDVDPCTGETSDRYYAMVFVDQGPPNGAVIGRWRWRPITLEGDFLPPTREIRAVSLTGVVSNPVANGLYAGQYHAPNFTFIPPENLAIGNPPVPINFQDFPFLAEGSGPYPSPTSAGRIGQLDPWPGSPAPSPVVCGANGSTFRAPIVDAGQSQQVGSGDVVTLDGNASMDSNDPPLALSFEWAQTSGPAVDLVGANSPTPTFTAPTIAPGGPTQTLLFALTVRNIPANLTATASVTVTVGDTAQPVDTLDVPVATFRMRRSVLTVNATSSNPNAILTLKGFGIMSPTNPPTPGHFQMVIVGVNLATLPNEVIITSTLGGFVTVPVTFLP